MQCALFYAFSSNAFFAAVTICSMILICWDVQLLKTSLILFVAGSDKKDQDKVIKQANKYFEDYIERNNYDINR